VQSPGGVGVNRFGRALYILWLIGLLVYAATAAIPNDMIACDVSTDYPDCTADEAIVSPTVMVTVERHSKDHSDSSPRNDVRTKPTALPRPTAKRILANRVLATPLLVLCSIRR
jgi:hypothetical protein